jgi:serine protease Do
MRRIALLTALGAGTAPVLAQTTASQPALCIGNYADDLGGLNAQARATDANPRAKYSYCVRNTAVYECLSYGSDGAMRRSRRTVTLHGTAFAFRYDADDTLLLTNQHVAEWPTVTDEDHAVDGVPRGCKKVSETLKIVDDEHDEYEHDNVPLVRVVSDPQLDMAVVRAHARIEVMPWKVGRSAALRVRNVVEVKGYPLGAFQATNLGKVVSAYDHDDFKDWDHDDFVVDALLSPGSSGSPVLAVSCATGELELVGVYHAAYNGGSALNVVVGIDQVRDLMTTLKRRPRARPGAPVVLDGSARGRLAEAIKGGESVFPFGPLTATARLRGDGALLFTVQSRDYPLKIAPILVVEDIPAGDPIGFGVPGRILVGGDRGLKPYSYAELDADGQAQVGRLLEGLRSAALATFDWRAAAKDAGGSRDSFEHAARLERTASRAMRRQADLAQGTADLADRLGPSFGEPVVAVTALDTATEPQQSPPASGGEPPEAAAAH